jgi:hypothetical protein
MDINKKINSSIGLLEKFESNIEILKECFESISITLPQDIKAVAQNTIEELKQLIAIFEDSFNPLELSDQINLSGNIFKSKVYSLGIESEIVRLRETGLSSREIAIKFGLAESTIIRFLKHFDTLSAVSKAKIKSISVMDTTERLEELLGIILRQIHRLEGINDEVHVKYIGELRQTLGLAANISEKIATYTSYQKFKEAVQEILVGELPERRLEIINKLKYLQNGGIGDTPPALPAHLHS